MLAMTLAEIVVRPKETREPVSGFLLVTIVLALLGMVVLIARMGKRKHSAHGAGMHKSKSGLDDGMP